MKSWMKTLKNFLRSNLFLNVLHPFLCLKSMILMSCPFILPQQQLLSTRQEVSYLDCNIKRVHVTKASICTSKTLSGNLEEILKMNLKMVELHSSKAKLQ